MESFELSSLSLQEPGATGKSPGSEMGPLRHVPLLALFQRNASWLKKRPPNQNRPKSHIIRQHRKHGRNKTADHRRSTIKFMSTAQGLLCQCVCVSLLCCFKIVYKYQASHDAVLFVHIPDEALTTLCAL